MRLLALLIMACGPAIDPCTPPNSEAQQPCAAECHDLGYHGPDNTVPMCPNCAFVNEGGRCVTWRLQ